MSITDNGIADKDMNAEYADYLERLEAFYSEREPLSFEGFVQVAERWEQEYGTAWAKEPPDFATVQELEDMLCV